MKRAVIFGLVALLAVAAAAPAEAQIASLVRGLFEVIAKRVAKGGTEGAGEAGARGIINPDQRIIERLLREAELHEAEEALRDAALRSDDPAIREAALHSDDIAAIREAASRSNDLVLRAAEEAVTVAEQALSDTSGQKKDDSASGVGSFVGRRAISEGIRTRSGAGTGNNAPGPDGNRGECVASSSGTACTACSTGREQCTCTVATAVREARAAELPQGIGAR